MCRTVWIIWCPARAQWGIFDAIVCFRVKSIQFNPSIHFKNIKTCASLSLSLSPSTLEKIWMNRWTTGDSPVKSSKRAEGESGSIYGFSGSVHLEIAIYLNRTFEICFKPCFFDWARGIRTSGSSASGTFESQMNDTGKKTILWTAKRLESGPRKQNLCMLRRRGSGEGAKEKMLRRRR